MTDSARLPGSHYWPGLPTPFWQWFRQVDASIGAATTATVDLSALTARVSELESDVAAIDTTPTVYTGFGAVRVNGQSIRLLNDVSDPGVTKYYGTDADGDHGWYSHAVSTLADVDLTGLVADDILRFNGTDWVRQAVSDDAALLLADADVPRLGTVNTWATTQTFTVAPVFTDAAGTRTALGGTTVGQSFFTVADPSAIRFARINADNTVTLLDAASFVTAIGAEPSIAAGTTAQFRRGDETWSNTLVGDIGCLGVFGQAGTSSLTLYQPTVDGSDTARVAIAGGGTAGANRGASVLLHGNEHATLPGMLRFVGGSTGAIELSAANPVTVNVPMHVVTGGTAITPLSATTFLLQRTTGAATTCSASIVAGNTAASTVNFGDTDAEDVAFLRYNHSTEEFSVKVGGTLNVLRLTTAQLTLPSTLAINNNTTAAASTAYADRASATYSQNSQSANYTLVAGDAGKHLYHPAADANARTFTIPANSSVAFPIGTEVLFINETANVVSIAITTDTLVLAGTGATGTRSLAQYGVARAIKVGATRWYISGTGIT